MLASAAVLMVLLEACAAEGAAPVGETVQADVVIVGATPGGIAAAVSAARWGRQVALLESEDHVGGIVSNGLTNADIGNRQAVAGLFYEFTRRVLRYYEESDRRAAGRIDEPAAGRETPGRNVTLCRHGYWYEASVAERIFREMLDGESPRIRVYLQQRLRQATLVQQTLVALEVEHRLCAGRLTRFQAPVFIDATYEGDLAALAGAQYRVGREGRDEYGEPHAGRVYARFGTRELLAGSTGEADEGIQGFCFRFHVTDDPANRVPVEQPADYRRIDYTAVLDDIRAGDVSELRQVIQFYPLPNGRFELNSDHPHPDTGVPSESFDLAEENWGWPEATPEERQGIYRRYLSHNVGLLWLLQNDPEVPEAIRLEASRFGWCRDLWQENGHLPRQVYVRQGRRILGDYVLTQRDGDLDPALARTRVQPASIAIVEFAFDSHGVRKFDPAHPGVREGYIYITHPPLQVPYGVLVPRRIEGLLVPVACSASHVGYNALRMEPVFMALGEAAGAAAHLAIQRQTAVRTIPVGELQHLLVARGAVVTHFEDLPFDHPAFAALQWLGTRGWNLGYRAEPDRQLTRREAGERLGRVLRREGIAWTTPETSEEPLTPAVAARWLQAAGLAAAESALRPDEPRQLDVAEFAQSVYSALRDRPEK